MNWSPKSKLRKISIIHVSRKKWLILWPELRHHGRCKSLFSITKKIPCISTQLHQNRYINKHEEKTEIFHNFFANQCSLIDNSNVLPSLLFKISETVIFFINFSLDDIAKVIQKLDPKKGHGDDVISIWMLKICGNSFYKPLQLIFRCCIENGKLSCEWEILFPFLRKVINKFGQLPSRFSFSLFEFFIENELISPN